MKRIISTAIILVLAVSLVYANGGIKAMRDNPDVVKNKLSFSEEKIDLYGKALERWANVHHMQIYINGVEILYYVFPSGGWGTFYWEYPYGGGETVLKDNRDKLRTLLTNGKADPVVINSFLTMLAGKSQVDIASVSGEELCRQLASMGTIGLKKSEFSPD